MAYTSADLTSIQRAIANGLTSAEIGGRKIVYRSLDEMRSIEQQIIRELAAGQPSAGAFKRVTFATQRE